MKTKDPDVRALAAACKAIEQSTSTAMILATLRFLWDRYIANPPVKAWWVDPRAKNPNKKAPRRG